MPLTFNGIYVALFTNVRKGGNIQNGVDFPLNSFHLTFFFPIFYRQASASNFKRVCPLKKIHIWPILHLLESPSKPDTSIAIIGSTIQALSSL
jgi:hypothetical protein